MLKILINNFLSIAINFHRNQLRFFENVNCNETHSNILTTFIMCFHKLFNRIKLVNKTCEKLIENKINVCLSRTI